MSSDRSQQSKSINKHSIGGFTTGIVLSALIFVWFIGFGQTTTSNDENVSSGAVSISGIRETSESAPYLTLQEILALESPSRRKAHLHAMVQGTDQEQTVNLIQESTTFDSSRKLRMLQSQLFQELSQISPHDALNQIREMPSYRWDELVPIVFAEWARFDLDEALREAVALDGSLHFESISAIFSALSGLTETELIKLAQQYGFESIAMRIIAEANARELIGAPEEAIKQVLIDDVSNKSQLSLLIEIVRLWTSVEDTEAFLPLFQLLHTNYDGDARSVQRIVESATENNPKMAWNVLMSMDQTVQERLHRGVLSVWVKHDPLQAFEAVVQHSNTQRHRSIRNYVVSAWARMNPSELLNNIPALPQAHHTSAVAAAVGAIARRQSVDEALHALRMMESQGYAVERAKDRLVREWVQTDPTATVEWILESTENDDARRNLLSIAIPRLTLTDPSRAMEVATEHPSENTLYGGGGLETQVIEILASNGLFAEAKALLTDVRESDRSSSYYALLVNLIDFNRPDEALEFIQDRWDSERVDLFSSVAAIWLRQKPSQLIEYLELISSKEQQTAVATTLSNIAGLRGLLNENQMNFVGKLLEQDSEE